jgi:UDP-2,4-diacetamido-2,4,6-trideoxy-beta-L-altropyranose hydrolase
LRTSRRKRVWLRADGSSVIGYGHLFRLLALAEILKSNFDCAFVSQSFPDAIKDCLDCLEVSRFIVPSYDYCHPDSKQAEAEIPFDLEAYVKQGEIVVTDGYWFGINYQMSVKERGCKLVCIDDYGYGKFVADVVINHAPSKSQLDYDIPSSTRLCMGLDYLLLRPIFLHYARTNRVPYVVSEKVSSTFVCLGGSRNPEILSQIVTGLMDAADMKRIVVIGELPAFKSCTTEILSLNNVSAAEMISYMTQCDLVICPPSTICLEACCVGVPVLTIELAANHRQIAQALYSYGAIYPLDGWNPKIVSTCISRLDLQSREQIVSKQKQLFNGKSIETICRMFELL